MKLLSSLLFLLLAGSAFAENWALRDTDRALSRSEVETLTAGKTITFYDEGQSKYSVGGAYSYTYASGEAAYGSYQVSEDGTICIQYQNGFSRCDMYVEAGGKVFLLTQKGLRFPIRTDGK